MFKRDRSYHGLDCVKDMEDPMYMEYMNQSQAKVSWGSQAHYGKVTVYFGVVVIFIAFVKNWWYRYTDYAYKRSSSRGVEPGYLGAFVATVTAFCRNTGYRPVTGPIQRALSLPSTMGNFLLAAASTLYLACYCFIPHFWYRECRGFGSPPLAVRAGIMSTALVPFIYVLAGKSNIISMLTGISYEKLNTMHQYTGVACFVLGVVHTIPFLWQDMAEGGASRLNFKFHDNFFYYSGIPPLILVAICCIGGHHWIRAHAYEWFLHIHWVCGCGFFGTLVWHISEMMGMWDYMWGALAFWMAQLIYRALVKTCFRPTRWFLRARPATLRKLSGEAYEIAVTNVADSDWAPGQHCYLRFVGTRILDNHPFSICSLPNRQDRGDTTMKFIVLPQKGLTRKMYDELDRADKKKVYVDGPYGGTVRDPLSFEQVALISTGTGVSACLPFMQHVARAIAAQQAVLTRHVQFTWIVRHEDDIEWVRQELEEAVALAPDAVSVEIYVCRQGDKLIADKAGVVGDASSASSASSDDAGSAHKASADDLEKTTDHGVRATSSTGLRVLHYKPDVKEIMTRLGVGLMRRNMIVSSGSASMRRAVCAAAADMQRAVLAGAAVEEVYLHSESYGW
ncbi:ferric-chelate reductase (NADPH) [[Candida] zeylanoides]